MGVYLYIDKDFSGEWSAFPMSLVPRLPAKFSGTSNSVRVYPGHSPIVFYDQEDFRGAYLFLVDPGQCADLSACFPALGSWANRIRSFHYVWTGGPRPPGPPNAVWPKAEKLDISSF